MIRVLQYQRKYYFQHSYCISLNNLETVKYCWFVLVWIPGPCPCRIILTEAPALVACMVATPLKAIIFVTLTTNNIHDSALHARMSAVYLLRVSLHYIRFVIDYLNPSLIFYHAFNTDTTWIFWPQISQCSLRTQQEGTTVVPRPIQTPWASFLHESFIHV